MTDKLDWQGRVGQEWAEKAAYLDAMMRPIGDAGLTALGDVSAKSVLDIGCGAGDTSRALTALGATVTGADISPDLLDIARTRGGADYLLADASRDDLGGPYDAVYSRCGAMFFADPVAGWRHIRQAARSGADLSIVCWAPAKDNGWAAIPVKIGRSIAGDGAFPASPKNAPGPFAWADTEYFSAILNDAGWQDVQWQGFETLVEIGAGPDSDPIERAVFFMTRIGSLARGLSSLSDPLRDEIKAALRVAFADYVQNDKVMLPAKTWVITGKA